MPLDGDRLARWARAAVVGLWSISVMRWGRVRSVRVVGREAARRPLERMTVLANGKLCLAGSYALHRYLCEQGRFERAVNNINICVR